MKRLKLKKRDYKKKKKEGKSKKKKLSNREDYYKNSSKINRRKKMSMKKLQRLSQNHKKTLKRSKQQKATEKVPRNIPLMLSINLILWNWRIRGKISKKQEILPYLKITRINIKANKKITSTTTVMLSKQSSKNKLPNLKKAKTLINHPSLMKSLIRTKNLRS